MLKKIDSGVLKWKSEYTVGHFRTDNEHMKLFNIARKAFKIQEKNKGKKATKQHIDELKAIIRSLYEYMGTHFKSEELFMIQSNYPDFPRHKVLHNDLLNDLHNLVLTLNDLTIEEIEIKLYDYIESYFIQHIIEEDKRIEYWNKSLSKLRKSTKWLKEYETGNTKIDKGHKKLFDILTEAFTEVKDDQRDQKIKDVLKHLYDFMKSYFKEEELFMKEISYPEMKVHQKEHDEIVNTCNDLVYKINNIDETI
ncbi:MAG: hemerythrin domain-containing protein, partial [Campylobacterota bacterium]|nr:hemerythrin domain-containing protein [Campylobacterota bacterium]